MKRKSIGIYGTGRNRLAVFLLTTLLSAVCFLSALMTLPVMAADGAGVKKDIADGDVIDPAQTGSVTIYKYDRTTAQKEGMDFSSLGSSVGEASPAIEENMAEYAVEGVEFSYLFCGEAETYSIQDGTENRIELVYEVPSDLCKILGLKASDAYVLSKDTAFPCQKKNVYHYSSTQISKGLKDFMQRDDSVNKNARNALEEYLGNSSSSVAMPLTDKDGKTVADNLKLGLYLFVETKVPEDVVETTDPWFACLPFTDETGDKWIYDLTCYPKNQTGMPTLEKLVRNGSENVDGTEKNRKDYSETATASEGDRLEYLFVSGLPHIHSKATWLTEYSFTDTLSEGLSYNEDVKIAFYDSKEAAEKNDLSEAKTVWTEESGYFSQEYEKLKNSAGVLTGESQMRVVITDTGLEQINQKESDKWVVVFYSADFHSDITAVLGDDGNPNDVELRWRRTSDSYYDTLKDECLVYTYGLQLEKLFSDHAGDPEKVQFVLYNETDGCYLIADNTGTIDEEKVYYVTDKTGKKEEATVFVPAKNGKMYIYGLEADQYQLTECKTDTGYQILKEPVEIFIEAASGTGDIKEAAYARVDEKEAAMSVYEITKDTYVVNDRDFGSAVLKKVNLDGEIYSPHASVVLKITNHRKILLPQTGGRGMYLITIAGIGLAVIGGFFMEKKAGKRKSDMIKNV